MRRYGALCSLVPLSPPSGSESDCLLIFRCIQNQNLLLSCPLVIVRVVPVVGVSRFESCEAPGTYS